MRLRNRGIGIGETFFPFKRLPIELRQLIWCLTLEARVVEVLCATLDSDGQKIILPSLEDLKSNDHTGRLPSPKDIAFTTLAKLPTTLRVNQDSRNAVLPFYPLCFASPAAGPRVRFNLSLDTLYLDYLIHMKYWAKLFLHFSTVERSSLKNLAISEHMGCYNSTWYRKGLWEVLGSVTTTILGFENIKLVYDATERMLDPRVDRNIENFDIKEQIYQAYDPNPLKRGVELCEEFPKELADRLGYTEDQTILFTDHELDWVKNTTLVWGWRRLKHATGGK